MKEFEVFTQENKNSFFTKSYKVLTKENLQQLYITLGICVISIMLMGRIMLMGWAGDGIVHLRVAELFAHGQGFQFNLGEPVVATTSLMWTFIISIFFILLNPSWVAHIVKFLDIILWFLTIFMVLTTWKSIYKSRLVGLISAALFAFNPGVFQNSVNGMEAILSALLHITLFYLVFVKAEKKKIGFLIVLIILSTMSTLTRPEGILFCLLLGGFICWRERAVSSKSMGLLAGAVVGVIVNLIVNMNVSGTIIQDSSVARMAFGLRESILIGFIHFHPRSIVRFIAYWPLTLGIVLSRIVVIKQISSRPAIFQEETPVLTNAIDFSFILIGVMLFIYTFVLGATHTIRYWIPFFPFVVGIGSGTLIYMYQNYIGSQRRLLFITTIVIIIWLLSIYYIEWRLRVPLVRYSHEYIVNAVQNREKFTDNYLRSLGVKGEDLPVKVAVTEVQVRYFLLDDGSVNILSLDGRTAHGFSRYIDWRTGMRKFDQYLIEIQPDFIEFDGQFHSSEPILYRVMQLLEEGKNSIIIVDGFRFLPVGYLDSGIAVKYLHEK